MAKIPPRTFELIPEGEQQGVMADQFIEWNSKTLFGIKNIINLWILTSRRDSRGRQLGVWKSMNFSNHRDSSLYQLVLELTGKPPDGDFDSDQLIGLPCTISIEHAKKHDGTTKHKINKIAAPDPNAEPVEVPEDFQSPFNKRRPAP